MGSFRGVRFRLPLRLPWSLTLRVQVPNYHIFSHIVTYIAAILNLST